jgi:hypothetical protein
MRYIIIDNLINESLSFRAILTKVPFVTTIVASLMLDSTCFVLELPLGTFILTCDRTTSKIRGLSPKIISGDSRRSGNAQTHTNKHTIPNMKFKLKLLQIKCHVLGFIKDKAQNVLQELIRVLRKRSSLTIDTRSSP